MDVEILSRIQFAFTVAFHYIFPPLSIGLGLMMVIFEGSFLKTKKKKYELLARFWTKIFAVTFGLGVATGIVMEFEFGTNWAVYSRYVGDVFGRYNNLLRLFEQGAHTHHLHLDEAVDRLRHRLHRGRE